MSLEHDLVRRVAAQSRATERMLRELGAVMRGYEVLLAECAHALHAQCHAAEAALRERGVAAPPSHAAHLRLAAQIDRLLARRAPPPEPVESAAAPRAT